MITSTLTSKAQTTIPLQVRKALHLAAGDRIVYSIEGERVLLSKASRAVTDGPFATFQEWCSEADAEAYGAL